MGAVALAEDEVLHLRVPAVGLMTEMYAGFEQALDVDLGGLHGLSHFARGCCSCSFGRGRYFGRFDRGLTHLLLLCG